MKNKIILISSIITLLIFTFSSCEDGFHVKSTKVMPTNLIDDSNEILSEESSDPSNENTMQNEGEKGVEYYNEIVKKYQLPFDYLFIKSKLKKTITTYQKYLDVNLSSKESEVIACNGSNEKIKYFQGVYNQIQTAYIALTFLNGSKIVSVEDSTFSNELKSHFIKIVDLIIETANVNDFHSLDNNLIGWTNLDSSWDAWNNNTCTKANTINLWSQGWVLYLIAEAYDLTKLDKYKITFKKGAKYFHINNQSNFNPNYPSYSIVNSTLSKYNEYEVNALFTLGGSRFQNDIGFDDPSKMIIRYHYTFEDPGIFALNDIALLSMALAKMSIIDQNEGFNISDLKGSQIYRSYKNLSFYSMYPVYGNLNLLNFGYTDMDSPFFKSKEYEDHLPFTLFYLNKTGQFLDNNYYINGARNAILNVIKSYPQINSNLYFNCLNRGLDDQLMINCKSIIKEKDPNLDNIYYLFSSTSL